MKIETGQFMSYSFYLFVQKKLLPICIVSFRLLFSFIPQKPSTDRQRVPRELYGPMMIIFTLIALLLFQMKTAEHKVVKYRTMKILQIILHLQLIQFYSQHFKIYNRLIGFMSSFSNK